MKRMKHRRKRKRMETGVLVLLIIFLAAILISLDCARVGATEKKRLNLSAVNISRIMINAV